ncbi:MAG: GNAT family N-acetyltransferase [Oscillospiraceae bacterium]
MDKSITHIFSFGIEHISPAYKIREEIFIKEQGFEKEFDEIDKIAWHVVLYKNNLPIATARLFPSDKIKNRFILGRICVLKEYRNLHLGSYILSLIEDKAKSLGGKELYLSSQHHVMNFYKKCGYIPIGKVYYDEHCPHISMIKQIVK